MNFATTKERILQFIDFKGIKIKEFYTTTGIKRGFLDSDKLKSSVSDVFITIIIAKFPDINPIWLITGEGNMLKEEQQEVSVQNTISTNDNEIISLLKAQLKDKEDKEALYKEKIADLEEKLKFAEFRDKKDMDFKIKAQRKEIKDIISEKDEIIFAQNEEINALKSRHLPPDEPLQPSKGL